VALQWRRNGEVTEWNPVLDHAILEMGIGVALCWPARPQEKGEVENLVGFVKSSFFRTRRFQDEEAADGIHDQYGLDGVSEPRNPVGAAVSVPCPTDYENPIPECYSIMQRSSRIL